MIRQPGAIEMVEIARIYDHKSWIKEHGLGS